MKGRCAVCRLADTLETEDRDALVEMVYGDLPLAIVAEEIKAEYPDMKSGLSLSNLRTVRRGDYTCCTQWKA